MTAIADKWQNLAQDMTAFGCDYLAENLANPDWCIKELARLGYSITITWVTWDYLGKALGDRLKMQKQDFQPHYRYRLLGPLYPDGTGFTPPPVTDLDICVATALFNICHQHWHEAHDTQSDAKHFIQER